MSQQIAVIGSGIAGTASAWLLSDRHQVTLIERNDYVGGHTHTIVVDEDERQVPVDTGFIVYNERNYPLLTRLFERIGIESRTSDMSFAASIGPGRIEYAGDNLGTLFAQRANLVRPKFLRMLADILRFNRHCKRLLAADGFDNASLGDFLDREGFGRGLREQYLLPMAAAIWSCPTRTMLDFPAESLARFFDNHGLLNVVERPQWSTVVGGSHQYVRRLVDDIGRENVLMDGAVAVRRLSDGVEVQLMSGDRRRFDAAVLACHADEALALIETPSDAEQALLGAFRYQSNQAFLHRDSRLMPRSRKVWASWNYLTRDQDDGTRAVSVTYWMNRLQAIDSPHDYLVSLNPLEPPADEARISEMTYHHPIFDQRAMQAQRDLHRLQGHRGLWFCGSYFGYGFHEDALRSAVEMSTRLGADTSWLTKGSAEPAAAQTPDAAVPAGSRISTAAR
jgi:predicted NAD/FAD-binding protein